jgi:putative ABC transport system ATP-binding protein
MSDVPSEDLVVVRDVRRTFRPRRGESIVTALAGVNLRVAKGSVTAIRGDSGSGKSTLLGLIGGLDRPDSGTITVNGHELTELSERDLVRFRAQTVGFVFQSHYLLPTLTALENVEFALEPLNIPPSERRERAMEALRLVGLRKRAQHRPGELSGGEQQRVGIARAIVKRPALVLADEPTGNLDRSARDNVVGFLLRVSRESGTTVIIVTHDPWVAERCDFDHKIKNGRITKSLRREHRERPPFSARSPSPSAPDPTQVRVISLGQRRGVSDPLSMPPGGPVPPTDRLDGTPFGPSGGER